MLADDAEQLSLPKSCQHGCVLHRVTLHALHAATTGQHAWAYPGHKGDICYKPCHNANGGDPHLGKVPLM